MPNITQYMKSDNLSHVFYIHSYNQYAKRLILKILKSPRNNNAVDSMHCS